MPLTHIRRLCIRHFRLPRFINKMHSSFLQLCLLLPVIIESLNLTIFFQIASSKRKAGSRVSLTGVHETLWVRECQGARKIFRKLNVDHFYLNKLYGALGEQFCKALIKLIKNYGTIL